VHASKAGDLAKIDWPASNFSAVQDESDQIETAIVNLRQQKIQLLLLLDDARQWTSFDVTGPSTWADFQPL